ncbi:MAG: hypothetical protein QG635_1175 [Bacteroidota bacterium]|nr:hypothetical protein [Bacteroidota bacterium]
MSDVLADGMSKFIPDEKTRNIIIGIIQKAQAGTFKMPEGIAAGDNKETRQYVSEMVRMYKIINGIRNKIVAGKAKSGGTMPVGEELMNKIKQQIIKAKSGNADGTTKTFAIPKMNDELKAYVKDVVHWYKAIDSTKKQVLAQIKSMKASA